MPMFDGTIPEFQHPTMTVEKFLDISTFKGWQHVSILSIDSTLQLSE